MSDVKIELVQRWTRRSAFHEELWIDGKVVLSHLGGIEAEELLEALSASALLDGCTVEVAGPEDE